MKNDLAIMFGVLIDSNLYKTDRMIAECDLGINTNTTLKNLHEHIEDGIDFYKDCFILLTLKNKIGYTTIHDIESALILYWLYHNRKLLIINSDTSKDNLSKKDITNPLLQFRVFVYAEWKKYIFEKLEIKFEDVENITWHVLINGKVAKIKLTYDFSKKNLKEIGLQSLKGY